MVLLHIATRTQGDNVPQIHLGYHPSSTYRRICVSRDYNSGRDEEGTGKERKGVGEFVGFE
jgi:hypothetical protein